MQLQRNMTKVVNFQQRFLYLIHVKIEMNFDLTKTLKQSRTFNCLRAMDHLCLLKKHLNTKAQE